MKNKQLLSIATLTLGAMSSVAFAFPAPSKNSTHLSLLSKMQVSCVEQKKIKNISCYIRYEDLGKDLLLQILNLSQDNHDRSQGTYDLPQGTYDLPQGTYDLPQDNNA